MLRARKMSNVSIKRVGIEGTIKLYLGMFLLRSLFSIYLINLRFEDFLNFSLYPKVFFFDKIRKHTPTSTNNICRFKLKHLQPSSSKNFFLHTRLHSFNI